MIFQLELYCGEYEPTYTLGIYSTFDKAQKAAIEDYEEDNDDVDFIISGMNLDAKPQFPSPHNQNSQYRFNATTKEVK